MQKQYAISMTPNEMKSALRLFKRFNLINYNESDFKSDTAITLYPTLQFAMDKDQFACVVKELTADLQDAALEEDSGEEEEL